MNLYKILSVLLLLVIICKNGFCEQNKEISLKILSTSDGTVVSNVLNSTNNTKTCDKSQLTALLLSIFVGSLGIDRFYLGYMDIGAGKLVLCIGPIFLILVCLIIFGLLFGFGAFCTFFSDKDFEDLCVCCGVANITFSIILIVLAVIIFCSAYLAVFVWWLVDLIFIATSQLSPLLPFCYATTL